MSTNETAWYECVACGQRGRYGERFSECPSCGGAVRNVGVSRE